MARSDLIRAALSFRIFGLLLTLTEFDPAYLQYQQKTKSFAGRRDRRSEVLGRNHETGKTPARLCKSHEETTMPDRKRKARTQIRFERGKFLSIINFLAEGCGLSLARQNRQLSDSSAEQGSIGVPLVAGRQPGTKNKLSASTDRLGFGCAKMPCSDRKANGRSWVNGRNADMTLGSTSNPGGPI